MTLAQINKFLKDSRGANMVEYIILVGVVAILAMAGFKYFGSSVQAKVQAQGDTVGKVQSE